MSSLYVINKDTKVASEIPTYLPAGVHENIKLVDAKTGETNNGNSFLGLYFEDKVGNKASFSDFPKNPEKPISAMSDEEKKNYKNTIDNQMSLLAQFVVALTGDKKVEITGNSFEEISKSLIELLLKHKDSYVRIKVTYDNKGWATISNKTYWATVIESMNVPKEETKITILPGDKLERPQKDEEVVENNPLLDEDTVEEVGEVGTVNDENDPF